MNFPALFLVWWLTNRPLKNHGVSEFVSWDDDIPNIWKIYGNQIIIYLLLEDYSYYSQLNGKKMMTYDDIPKVNGKS